MRFSDVVVSAGTRKRLGSALGDVCGWLWPEDCQTCGRPLKGQPALCIDDCDAFATASLHHPGCRRAAWNESAFVSVSPVAGPSWTSQAYSSFPLIRREPEPERDLRPFLLVNPSLEMVFLKRADSGWEPEIAKSFPAAGLQVVGQVEVDRPVEGLTASLSGGTVTVRMLVPPFEAYTSPVDGLFAGQARDKRGLLFGVTHLVNPAVPIGNDQVEMLVRTKTIIMGWVGLRP